MVFQSCIQAMGTRLQLVLPHVDIQLGEYLQTMISNRIDTLEQALSLYRNDSALCQLNEKLAISEKVTIENHDLLHALLLSEQGVHYTKGFYDPACGALIKLVKEGKQSMQDKQTISPRIIDENIFSITENNQIVVNRKGILFDFGGLGKGIALDEVKAILMAADVEQGLISFGESSILAIGKHPHGEYWPIAVPSPFSQQITYQTAQQPSLVEVQLKDCGLTLSSTVANGANNGAMQLHIVNPITGKVIDKPMTTVVQCESMAWGEMLSTASLISGVEFNQYLLPDYVGLKNIQIYTH